MSDPITTMEMNLECAQEKLVELDAELAHYRHIAEAAQKLVEAYRNEKWRAGTSLEFWRLLDKLAEALEEKP